MSYVINTVAAAPMPGWATGSTPTTPVTAATSSAALPATPDITAHTAASVESFSPSAVSQFTSAASLGASITGPTMLPVSPTVSTDSGDAGTAAPKMLAVTSVFTGSDDDSSALLDHASSTDLPFTHVAATDSDAAGSGDVQVADVGSDVLGWYLV